MNSINKIRHKQYVGERVLNKIEINMTKYIKKYMIIALCLKNAKILDYKLKILENVVNNYYLLFLWTNFSKINCFIILFYSIKVVVLGMRFQKSQRSIVVCFKTFISAFPFLPLFLFRKKNNFNL